MERAIETQRLRLLRLLAGLVIALGFLSVGPVSRGFSVWACRFVGSVLSRAEMAARCLVVGQARVMAAPNGFELDRDWVSRVLTHALDAPEAGISVCECRARLRALQAVLRDLPRYALRLLRRMEKRIAARPGLRLSPQRLSASLQGWRLPKNRIERPPDIGISASLRLLPPPGFRLGGEGGWTVFRQR